MNRIEDAEKIIARFEQAGKDYSDDVLKKARQSVEELEIDGYASSSDYEGALLSLPSPRYAFRVSTLIARKAIQDLPNEARCFGWDEFEARRRAVRQQISSAYSEAVRIIENGAIDYLVGQHDFLADIDGIPAEKRKEMFRKAWDATVAIKNGARLSVLMEAFDEMLNAIDFAVFVAPSNDN